MPLGFACLESGLTQKKSTVNILFKNVFIIYAGILGPRTQNTKSPH
jgi:Amt family ammonium transporter